MKKLTVRDLINLKGIRKAILTTAFDYNTAAACEEAGIDMLVTWAAMSGTQEEALAVIREVRKGAPNILIGAGMPRSIAFTSETDALRCAYQFLDHGADIVYASGMELAKFKALAKEKIPCVGHVGLLPIHATWFGGLRAVGKTSEEAAFVFETTRRFEDAGVIGVEMECVPAKVAAQITSRVKILTFSMGSGADCDGQFIFSCDLLGSHNSHYPRHSIKYCDFFNDSVKAFMQYRNEIQSGMFPGPKNSIEIDNEEYERFMTYINQNSTTTSEAKAD